jgi:uncharacterized protein (DUF2062 family)
MEVLLQIRNTAIDQDGVRVMMQAVKLPFLEFHVLVDIAKTIVVDGMMLMVVDLAVADKSNPTTIPMIWIFDLIFSTYLRGTRRYSFS